MAVFREPNKSTWTTDKLIITDINTKEERKYRVLRDISWNLMSKDEWEELKNEIDLFYENINFDEIVIVDEEKNTDNQTNEHVKIKGYVYLIQADNGFIKIGRTIDIKNRFKTLAIQLPYKIKLLGVIETDDYIGLEEQLHLKYKNNRANGEWFRLNEDEIRELLKQVNV